jgi:hypothetical protein
VNSGDIGEALPEKIYGVKKTPTKQERANVEPSHQ